jgi:hypothetical protein
MLQSLEGILIKAVIKRELIFLGVNNALGEPNAPERLPSQRRSKFLMKIDQNFSAA